MDSNSPFADRATTRSDRKRTPVLLSLVAIAVGSVLAGCADDVVMQNPRTGMSEVCQQSLRGLNPWSQTMACVANHEAKGWIRTSQP
jgi:hypothetical protein